MTLNTTIKPLISEKSIALAEGRWFSFRAPVTLKKADIAAYCKLKYNTNPEAIHMVRHKALRRRRGKNYFQTSAFKVFRIKLAKDVKITDFEVK